MTNCYESCFNLNYKTDRQVTICFLQLGLLLPQWDFQQSCMHKPSLSFWGWGGQNWLVYELLQTLWLKKLYLSGNLTLSVYTVDNLATNYAILKNSTELPFTWHAKEHCKTWKAVDNQVLQCQRLIFGLEVTAGTSATLQNFKSNWWVSTIQDPSLSATKLCHFASLHRHDTTTIKEQRHNSVCTLLTADLYQLWYQITLWWCVHRRMANMVTRVQRNCVQTGCSILNTNSGYYMLWQESSHMVSFMLWPLYLCRVT